MSNRRSLSLDRELVNRRSTRNFYISLLLSCLLHLLIWWLLDYGYKFFHKQPKLVKINPSNLLVLKRGRSLDPTKHTQGALKPSRAAPLTNPHSSPERRVVRRERPRTMPRHRERHRVEQPRPEPREKRHIERPRPEPQPVPTPHHQEVAQNTHKALKKVEQAPHKPNPPAPAPVTAKPQHKSSSTPKPPPQDDFNPNNLSFLPSEQSTPSPTPQQNARATRSYEHDKGLDSQTRKDIDDLYGEEFGDLGTAEKDFIKSNLSEIGRITQKYLEYPSAAGYLGQDGVDAVEFYLHPNGDITGLKIITPSGYKLLDDNTLKTITIAYKDYPRPTTTTLIRIRVRYFIYR
ncbi:energy transducer TonB [Helicobacter cynogastricus]|uniref:energy transducer TonB n=1 Tax=Helicobacter cynogastricus TaxID=329937 RepID=UPI000CF17788|nr:TonB family protein [Helicobacter cynogastricus]